MNGKQLLLIACLACSWTVTASAQGLVGAPVDPRYGASAPTVAQSKNPPASRTLPGGMAQVALAVLVFLRAVLR